MSKLLSLLVITVFLTVVSAGKCQYKFEGGESYDFSHIGTLSGEFKRQTAYLNFCEDIPDKCTDGGSSICVPKVSSSWDISFASKSRGAVAPVNTYDSETKINTIREKSGAEQCYDDALKPREVAIKITCGSKTDDRFQIIDLLDHCKFEIALTVDCDSGGGLSGGAIFLIIFFSVFAAYFIIGFIVCKFVLKKEGIVNAIPQGAFWCALPGLYIGGIKFVIGKITGKGKANTIDYNSSDGYGATEDV